MGVIRVFASATSRSMLVSALLAMALTSMSGMAVAEPGSKGTLRLQLGYSSQQVIFKSFGSSQTTAASLTQSINFFGKCGLKWTGDNLIDFDHMAIGGNGSLGLGTGSIGVFDGPKGVACYRVSASEQEALEIGFGPGFEDKTGANAFDRLEIDVETKNNARLLLQVKISGTVTAVYELRTGSSIVNGVGISVPQESDPDHKILNCNSQSDSGPDAGAGDNCRWVINDLGQSFRIIPVVGEFSLEGGGDWGAKSYDNNTVVYLTQAEIGVLGCGVRDDSNVNLPENTSTIGDGINDAYCGVTRIDPSELGGTCETAIAYLFRNIGGSAEGCELVKSPGEQLAASIDITFPAEAVTALGAEPKTRIYFSDGQGGQKEFTPDRCTGTVVKDKNGNLTILEVLTVPGFAPDQVLSTPNKDWACILDQSSQRRDSFNPDMQVTQKILFWGDISFARGAN